MFPEKVTSQILVPYDFVAVVRQASKASSQDTTPAADPEVSEEGVQGVEGSSPPKCTGLVAEDSSDTRSKRKHSLGLGSWRGRSVCRSLVTRGFAEEKAVWLESGKLVAGLLVSKYLPIPRPKCPSRPLERHGGGTYPRGFLQYLPLGGAKK